MTRRLLPLAFATLLVVLIGGCAEPVYVPDYTFVPQPAVVDVVRRDTGGGQPPVRPLTVLVTVSGVRYEDAAHHVPRSVEIRLRFENNGALPVQFDPNTLDLVTGSLRPFEQPSVVPAQVPLALHVSP